MKTERSEGAGEQREELRKVAGKAAEVGSSRQRMDRAQAGKRSPCAVQGVGLAGWWQEAEEVWREAKASSESWGRRTGGLRAASAPPQIPVCLFPQACRVKVPACAFPSSKLGPSILPAAPDPFYISSSIPQSSCLGVRGAAI